MTATGANRLVGLDIARFVAICGMVIVNFTVAAEVDSAGSGPLDVLVHSLQGRAAATFVVLAGVGLALLSKRARTGNDATLRQKSRVTILRRALFLLVVGTAFIPVWPADILHFYGAYLAIATVLLFVSNRVLYAAWAGIIVVAVAMLVLLDYERGWNFSTITYVDQWSVSGFVRHLLFNGFHPVFPWLAFVVAGLWIGRLRLDDQRVATRLLIGGAVMAFAATTVSRLLVTVLTIGVPSAEVEEVQALFGTGVIPPGPLYVVTGTGVAAAVIGGCVLLGQQVGQAPALAPIIATGQQALSVYFAHVIFGLGALEALGLLSGSSLPVICGAAVVFCVAAVVGSHWWGRRFDRGPVEIVMRRLS